MRIAQVAPLYESVPPKLYGGTERVVSYLTEELVEMGHEVTLFASGDSETAARIIPGCESSLRLSKGCIDPLARHYVMLDDVMERAEEFDIIHFHVDYLHFPLSRISRLPHITTLHGRLDLPDLVPLYRKFRGMPVVSISKGQRKPLCWANWVGNVYHGLPSDSLSVGNGSGKYLAFLGRICPEKRVDRAIQVALQTGMPLKIAAKVDRVDREYYECKIKEPFGLTMIEAMACGTPTIAFNCGSVPEVITHGVSGLIVDSVLEAVSAVEEASTLDRTACRQEFERRFTASRMARDYLTLYEAILSARSLSPEPCEIDSMLTN